MGSGIAAQAANAGIKVILLDLPANEGSKNQISEICKTSEVTISKCYKKLLKYHKHLLPPEIIEQLY